jgi:hypothetical protein
MTVPSSSNDTATHSGASPFRIAAVGLTNPRGIAWDDDGTMYVASGGMGGDRLSGPDRHIEAPLGPYRGGPTGQIYKVDQNGMPTVFVDGLPSTRDQFRGKQGVSDVKWVDGKLYALIVGAGQAHGNPDSETGILRIEADGSWEQFAFIGPWHREHPVASEVPHYFPEGSLFAFTWNPADGAFWFSEANSNYVGRITLDGKISRIVDLSASNDVMSGITPSPNGGVYVGHMSVVPYGEGQTFVSEVLPDGTVRRAWTGLTMVAGLAQEADGTLVASFMSTGNTIALPHFRPNAGKIVRQAGLDSFETIARNMTLPIRVEVGPNGWLYVSTPGIGADNGSGIVVAIHPKARDLDLSNAILLDAAEQLRAAGMVLDPALAPRRYPHEIVPGEDLP